MHSVNENLEEGAPSKTRVRRHWVVGPWMRRAMAGAFIFMVGAGLFVIGARLRQWTWVQTEEIRFMPNIDNAYVWGSRVNHDEQPVGKRNERSTWGEFWRGYRRIYEKEWEAPSMRAMLLDYAPMRLLTVSLWARSVPGPPEGQEIQAFVKGFFGGAPPSGVWRWEDVWPILGFNTFCAAAAAIGALVLVRYWIRRQQMRDGLLIEGSWWRRSKGWIYGSVAAILLWLNPAVLVDGHGWPQWDIWCVPFYIWGAFAASVGMWFLAGVLLMIGAMFKAQLMLVGGVLLVWAICAGGLRPMLRFILGFVTTGAVMTSMWLLPTAPAWIWLGAVVGVAMIGAGAWRLWKKRWPRKMGYWMALVVTLGVASGCYIYGGSFAWLQIGFLNPTEGHPALSMGATNLPAVLQTRYAWNIGDLVWKDWLTIRDLLRVIYGVTLILCGVAAAVQSRRGSARVLLALAAPWLLLYALMPQLHERHSLWAAAITAITVGVSLDYVWLHLIVTALAAAGILRVMLPRHAETAPSLLKFFNGLMPDTGWVILLIAAIYFWQAWKMERRRLPLPESDR